MADETERTMVRRVMPDAAAEPDSLLHLLVIEAPGEAPRRMPLGRAPIRVGRIPGNDIVLPSTEISRAHCLIALEGEDAVVTDLDSTNGCIIDGARIVAPAVLRPGARMRLGPYAITHLRGPRAELERGAAMERDLAKAGHYVQALLPPAITDGPVRVDWRFLPSASIGGDGFGYRMLPDGRFAAYLLDVSGHGAGAALLAVSVMNALRQGGPAGCDAGDPAAVLAGLNAGFQMDSHGGLYFSLWYGVYDPATRRLGFAAAGHHPAYLGAAPLWTRNPAIGLAEPDWRFATAEAAVPPASRLVLFSDGAFEVRAPDGRQLGLADFLLHLTAPAVPGVAEPARLLAAAQAAARPGAMEDDVSILVLDFP
ncbi:PP2C family protein-serine/threonine phosphatase [Plastoroseomonas hellenica]|uniref:PP2C family protein-serine/threonine phosphatase n=1 Tax=Plastoroseomonas hellenica TaxID=2687306 RepID=UPI001BAA1EFC|nr:SpoIIE family protein phosphatase [Plastoroseomonas hellenica]MBR0642416.1 SpoIIE family protein phosphatase [Plastoroseomonas hellenica]